MRPISNGAAERLHRNGDAFCIESAFGFCVCHVRNRYDAVNLILSREEAVRLNQEEEAWRMFQQREFLSSVLQHVELIANSASRCKKQKNRTPN